MLDSRPYMRVASLDEVACGELAARRALLEQMIACGGPGPAVAGELTGALAGVIAEQQARAGAHAAWRRRQYACSCGVRAEGLAALDDHLDAFPDGDVHCELAG